MNESVNKNSNHTEKKKKQIPEIINIITYKMKKSEKKKTKNERMKVRGEGKKNKILILHKE